MRTSMEQRFGQDFSAVRVHTDTQAAESARAVNALAFTLGHHVAFARGQYSPASSYGQRLLAHELTHVVQQQRSGVTTPGPLRVSDPGERSEREASAVADAVMRATPVPAVESAPTGIQRTCGAALGAPTPDCEHSGVGV